jgi:hypothetical protein
MTAGGVPAIDFGLNRMAENQPASFRSIMAAIPGNGSQHTTYYGSGSPGACSVSDKCYRPNVLVEKWIMPRLAASPNLRVFLRTAVTDTTRGPDGTVASITAVQRFPKDGTVEWSQRLSDELPDWYHLPPQPPTLDPNPISLSTYCHLSYCNCRVDLIVTAGSHHHETVSLLHMLPVKHVHLDLTVTRWLVSRYSPMDSDAFSKTVLTLKGKVFIEATELGDVLTTSGVRWSTSSFSCLSNLNINFVSG